MCKRERDVRARGMSSDDELSPEDRMRFLKAITQAFNSIR